MPGLSNSSTLPAATASIKELMATFLSRDMLDGEEIFVGTNLPVIRAGALLAHFDVERLSEASRVTVSCSNGRGRAIR